MFSSLGDHDAYIPPKSKILKIPWNQWVHCNPRRPWTFHRPLISGASFRIVSTGKCWTSNLPIYPSGSPRFWKVVGSLSSWSKVVYYIRRTYFCRWESMTSSRWEPTIDSGFVSDPSSKNYFFISYFRFTIFDLRFPFLFEVRKGGTASKNWSRSNRSDEVVLLPCTRYVTPIKLNMSLLSEIEAWRGSCPVRFSPFRRVNNINSTKTKHQRSTGTYTESDPIQSKPNPIQSPQVRDPVFQYNLHQNFLNTPPPVSPPVPPPPPPSQNNPTPSCNAKATLAGLIGVESNTCGHGWIRGL